MEAAFQGLSCAEFEREDGDQGEESDARAPGGGAEETKDLLTQPDHPDSDGVPSVGTAEGDGDDGGTAEEAEADPAADGREAPELQTQPEPDDRGGETEQGRSEMEEGRRGEA